MSEIAFSDMNIYERVYIYMSASERRSVGVTMGKAGAMTRKLRAHVKELLDARATANAEAVGCSQEVAAR